MQFSRLLMTCKIFNTSRSILGVKLKTSVLYFKRTLLVKVRKCVRLPFMKTIVLHRLQIDWLKRDNTACDAIDPHRDTNLGGGGVDSVQKSSQCLSHVFNGIQISCHCMMLMPMFLGSFVIKMVALSLALSCWKIGSAL